MVAVRVSVQWDVVRPRADVAELADALDSGSSKGNLVEVQVLSSAPIRVVCTESAGLAC